MDIICIQGFAGTGKTTTIAKLISTLDISDYVGLAYTHSAVNNLFRKVYEFNKNANQSSFKTLHSFFRIDSNGNLIGSIGSYRYVFIDEYSMVDYELFMKIKYDLKQHGTERIYLSGDYLQLPRIGAVSNSINADIFAKLNGLVIVPELIEPLKHFNQLSALAATKIITKTVQLRNSNNRYLEWLMNGTFIRHINELPFVSFDEVTKLIGNGYTFIASKYKLLDQFKPELTVGQIVYGTETDDEIINGTIYKITSICNKKVLCENVNDHSLVFFTEPYKCYPIELYTFHKSQGLTFDNVIICIDELFEFPMLYTGITRSAGDIKFFSFQSSVVRNEKIIEQCGQKQIQLLIKLFELWTR